MNLKYIENLPNVPSENLMMAIKGIQIRLDKNEDNNETRSWLGERQGVYIAELQRRGLSYE